MSTGIPSHIEEGGSEIVVGNGRGGPTGGAGPIERLTVARPVLPCPGCAHAAVCSIRPTLNADTLALRTPPSPHEAIRIRLAVEIECAHFLAGAPVAPEPARPFRQTSADIRESSRRGAEASKRLRAAAKAPEAGGGPGKVVGYRSRPKSPETRERMRLAQLALAARRRAAAAGSAVSE